MEKSPIYGFGKSFVGKYREDNQDAVRLHEPDDSGILETHGYLYGIADGMGGYSHGGVASNTALTTFFETFYAASGGKLEQNLRNATTHANTGVFQLSHKHEVRMGTTLSVLNIIGNRLSIAHVGDSRVYLVRGQQVTCLTNDHTSVGELVRLKLLDPSLVRTHERRSVLDRCLGLELFVQPDITQHTIKANDYLVMCTDGVWGVIEDDEFGRIVHDVRVPELITEGLIEQSMERDSDDNVSAITIHIQQPQMLGREVEDEKAKGLTGLFRKFPFTRSVQVAK